MESTRQFQHFINPLWKRVVFLDKNENMFREHLANQNQIIKSESEARQRIVP